MLSLDYDVPVLSYINKRCFAQKLPFVGPGFRLLVRVPWRPSLCFTNTLNRNEKHVAALTIAVFSSLPRRWCIEASLLWHAEDRWDLQIPIPTNKCEKAVEPKDQKFIWRIANLWLCSAKPGGVLACIKRDYKQWFAYSVARTLLYLRCTRDLTRDWGRLFAGA